jgi:peptide deformylase
MKLLPSDNKKLRQICKPVKEVDDDVRSILDDMVDYCKNSVDPQVLSLAANQVGLLKRLIVIVDYEEIFRLANPVITKSSGKEVFFEACASVRKEGYCVGAFVERPAYIELDALNYNNEKVHIKASGVLAVMLQHEIDHLDGILYTDKMVSEFYSFKTPAERVEFRKAHPLKVLEEPNID